MKVRKKGVLILPKKLREASGIDEDSEVVEAKQNMLVVKPFKPPTVVDIDPKLVEKVLSEEHELERRKYGEILEGD